MGETMTAAILISGETYKFRHDLRRLGGTFDHREGGYVFAAPLAAPVAHLVEENGLNVSTVDLDYDPAAPLTPEQIRERRNARRLRRADRLDSQAATRERDAAAARKRHEPYTSDYSFITQPILVGHHSEKRHRRIWDKIDNARNAEMRNRIEASELRDRADYLRNVSAAVKGDAVERHQAARDISDKFIGVGAKVESTFYGRGVVLKVNKNTFTVQYDRGFTNASDKAHFRLIEAAPPSYATVKPVRKFKKGQRVAFQRLLWKGEGEIIRVNPTGYTVRLQFYGKMKEEKFNEGELSAIGAA